MGMLKWLGNFMFGKNAQIFDENGHVLHQFPEEKWAKWNNRLKTNPDYNWHLHAGKEFVLHPEGDANRELAPDLIGQNAKTPVAGSAKDGK